MEQFFTEESECVPQGCTKVLKMSRHSDNRHNDCIMLVPCTCHNELPYTVGRLVLPALAVCVSHCVVHLHSEGRQGRLQLMLCALSTAANFNFMTECFHITQRALHVGLGPTLENMYHLLR